MKAEDTILKTSVNDDDGTVHFPTQREQAEASFKAGREDGVSFCHRQFGYNLLEIMENCRQEGIKEVFDFLHDNSVGIMMNEHALQAKLKEWGIE